MSVRPDSANCTAKPKLSAEASPAPRKQRGERSAKLGEGPSLTFISVTHFSPQGKICLKKKKKKSFLNLKYLKSY